jgi:hypothetical protein
MYILQVFNNNKNDWDNYIESEGKIYGNSILVHASYYGSSSRIGESGNICLNQEYLDKQIRLIKDNLPLFDLNLDANLFENHFNQNNLLNDIFSPPPLIGNPLNIEIEKYRITIKFRELYRYDGKPIEISGISFERI